MDKGKAFWGNLLEPLKYKVAADMGRMVLFSCGRDKPMLGIYTPYDGNEATFGNGTMLAFTVGSRDQVNDLYAKALELGGTDEGEPGERGPTFYGGYFRDPDGNKAVFFAN